MGKNRVWETQSTPFSSSKQLQRPTQFQENQVETGLAVQESWLFKKSWLAVQESSRNFHNLLIFTIINNSDPNSLFYSCVITCLVSMFTPELMFQ